MIVGKSRLIRILVKVSAFPIDICKFIYWKYNYSIFAMKSLFYNEFISTHYIFEIILEPMFWIVDHFAKFLGPILVAGVVILTTSVVTIVYMIGLPYYWHKYPNLTIILMVYGHWLLFNVIFHFIMGFKTDPGTPPKGILISEAVSVCKKCIAPKPPRTHHCSVCNRCIMKMDHHCPWLNNCVGHYNHRYFYMYMVYMVLGTTFIMIFGFEIFYQEIWLGGESGGGWRSALFYYLGWEEHDVSDLHVGYPVKMNGTHFAPSFGGTTGIPTTIEEVAENDDRRKYWSKFIIIYSASLTAGAFISLGMLSTWHGRLITRGETSIEAHINKKETERMKKINKVYKNPYNFGPKENWRRFLGITHGRSIGSILFPSTHPPRGNGLTWPNSPSVTDHDKIV